MGDNAFGRRATFESAGMYGARFAWHFAAQIHWGGMSVCGVIGRSHIFFDPCSCPFPLHLFLNIFLYAYRGQVGKKISGCQLLAAASWYFEPFDMLRLRRSADVFFQDSFQILVFAVLSMHLFPEHELPADIVSLLPFIFEWYCVGEAGSTRA